ncbi:hypothetical protein [Streptomyces sp. SID13031]|uniref:hypothetical protein n=1 Tax=Streptomyces sp. SID13031 TaxID=2706046 RepID=UPI0013CA8A28|nr:hypothetical protein [Streptomyces sp. SID13031]NEA36425.1 hypothetical protein [Streptomyces sp. SID13031]
MAQGHTRNAGLSRRMNRFFRRTAPTPELVAKEYAKRFITGPDGLRWRQGARFAVSVLNSFPAPPPRSMPADNEAWLLERTRLIVDTLVLPDHRPGEFHPLLLSSSNQAPLDDPMTLDRERQRNYTEMHLGIHTPNLTALGRRILAAEPLLRTGIVHLIPNYADRSTTYTDYRKADRSDPSPRPLAPTFVLADRLFVDAGQVPPESWAVKHLISTQIPYVEGVQPLEFDRTLQAGWSGFETYRRQLRTAYATPSKLPALLATAESVLRSQDRFRGRVRTVPATLVSVDHGAFANAYLPSRSTGDLWNRIAEPPVFEPYLPSTDLAWILDR